MRKEVFKRSAFSIVRGNIAYILFTLIIVLLIVYGLDQTERAQKAEGIRILREGILRAAVTCYAIEGSYPESIAYIEEHYGLHVDRTKYVVDYDVFSENIMPVITVTELE